MIAKKMPRVGILLFAALLAACATSIREPVDPSSPLSEPSPSLEAGIETFFRLNLGERIDALALSGGGQNGAYGVGLIKGWREIGIPRFDVVTGVSTGALIASHVFLDSPEADRVIERFYTSVRRSDILCTRNPVLALGADSVASMVPLERLIENVVPDAVIDDVARASEGGKRLLMVGTVNLDTGGYRMWDLGAMARAGQYDKYRAVLRASAGPPVAVSPVYLEGEMHCDGSTASSVFIPFGREHLGDAALARLEADAARRGVPAVIPGTIHVVVNGLREPSEERVKPGLLDIAERALDVMGYSNRLGNLWYVYARVTEAEGTFRLRFIPESLREEADDFLAFDPKLMRAIFEQGVKDGRNPDIWESKPPLLRPDR
jgi:predicted acylesterase/phospholipase RssA